MDVGIATVLAAMIALVAGTIGAIGGTYYAGRLQTKRDTTAYERRLQDESRERQRQIYLELVHTMLVAIQLCDALLVLAYGHLPWRERRAILRKNKSLQARIEMVDRQSILASFESNLIGEELMSKWNANANAFNQVITGARIKRFRFGNEIGRFMKPAPTKADAEKLLGLVKENYLAFRTAVQQRLVELSEPDASAQPALSPRPQPPAPPRANP